LAAYVLQQASGEIPVELQVFGPNQYPISEPFIIKVSKQESNEIIQAAKELVDLGIGTLDVCLAALRMCDGDKEAAVNHILGQF